MSGTTPGPSRRTLADPAPGSADLGPDARGSVVPPPRTPADRPAAEDGARPRHRRPDDLVRELVVRLRTGGRDLHGGQDRVDLVVEARGMGPDGAERPDRTVVAGVEHGRWWLDHSEHAVRLVLPRPTPAADLRALEVVVHLRGGPPDRTWDLDALAVSESGGAFRVHARGAPLHRFPVGEGSAYRLPLHVIGS